jgi:fatty acid amide hydrolase
LAALLASGEIASLDAVEAHIERIQRVNGALNAVVFERYESARAEARAADARRARGDSLGPLHGLPITIKECLDLEGAPSTFGLPSRTRHVAAQDDLYVARLRAAGAIVLGKTNVAQLLFHVECENPVYGRTNNPWNLDRTSGGSSGGEGAIIAAGGSPLGLGTDIGGSLRYPAAHCGIASLKPTAGRTPDAGRYSSPIGQRAIVSQVGVLARRVADVALGTEVINGGRAPKVEPPLPLGDLERVELSELRVATYVDDGTFAVAPAIRRAVGQAAAALRAAGASVSEWQPPDVGQALDLFLSVMSADGGAGMKQLLGRDKRDPRISMLLAMSGRSQLTLGLLGRLLRLAGQPGMAEGIRNFGHRDTWHYWQVVEAQMAYQRRFAEALDRADGGPFDLIVCPATSLPAWRHGAARDLILGGTYTVLYNVLGYPAGVVPVTRVRPGEELGRAPSRDLVQQAAYNVERDSAGLPVGVQVVARPWREHVALAAMRAIEDAARAALDFPATPAI